MDTISFSNAFCEIAQCFYGQEEGMLIAGQFEQYAKDIIYNLNLEHDSPCYDFYNIVQIITYIDAQVLGGIEISLLPFPYREGMKKIKQTMKTFWYQRHLFYQNNGKASVFLSENRSRKTSYMLFFNKKILDGLDKEKNSGLPGYGNFPTAHCRKMRQIFQDFRQDYGEGWESIPQKDFFNYVEQKITKEASVLALTALWRDFYDGDIDPSLEVDGL
jgi:hypothetical protein